MTCGGQSDLYPIPRPVGADHLGDDSDGHAAALTTVLGLVAARLNHHRFPRSTSVLLPAVDSNHEV